ncbi:MAG: ABC transporter substrate-binding protein [Lactobacillus sp.]|jgi:branched-chain amino acid transport system substrate-binding protein|nr:ABC transporter substrate-binding protein [Lactobacillus sp.]
MKKVFWALVVIAVGAYGAYYGAKEEKVLALGDKPVVKIGVILPLTGDAAQVGQNNKGAVLEAMDKIAKIDTKYNYQFVFEDNAYEIKRTKTALTKLLEVDKVDAIVDIGVPEGRFISEIAEKQKFLRFNVMSSDPEVAKGKYNFVNWTMPDKEAEKMVELINKKGYKRVLSIAVNDISAVQMDDALRKVMEKNGIALETVFINPGTRDFKTQINKAKQDGVDFYVTILFPPEIYVFMKQLREVGVEADVSAIESFSFFDDLSPFEGDVYVDAAQGSGEVFENIKKRNDSDNTHSISNSYDTIMLVVKAYENTETKDQVVDELIKIKEYDGVTGKLMQDEEGVFQSEAIFKQIIDGKPVVVE